MSVKYYVEALEQLLNEKREEAGYNRKDIKYQLIYDRGYLVGFLAQLANDDSFVGQHVRHRLNEYKSKK